MSIHQVRVFRASIPLYGFSIAEIRRPSLVAITARPLFFKSFHVLRSRNASVFVTYGVIGGLDLMDNGVSSVAQGKSADTCATNMSGDGWSWTSALLTLYYTGSHSAMMTLTYRSQPFSHWSCFHTSSGQDFVPPWFFCSWLIGCDLAQSKWLSYTKDMSTSRILCLIVWFDA